MEHNQTPHILTPAMLARSAAVCAATILALALLTRLVVIFALGPTAPPPFETDYHHAADMLRWTQGADQLFWAARATGDAGLHLAAVTRAVLGESYKALRLADAMLWALTAAALAWLLLRHASPALGWTAGLLVALAPPLVDAPTWIWPLHVAPLWLVILAWLTLTACRAATPWQSLLSGGAAGLSWWFDPRLGLVWVVCALAILLWGRVSRPRLAALFCLGALVTCLYQYEWERYLAARLHVPSDTRVASRVQPFWMFLETNGWAADRAAPPPAPPIDAARRAAWVQSGTTPEPQAWSVGWRAVRDNPGAALQSLLGNMHRLWSTTEPTTGIGPQIPAPLAGAGRALIVVLALCAAGACLAHPALGVCGLLALYWTLATGLTCATPGDRLVALPLLLALAGAGGWALFHGWRDLANRRLGIGLLVLGALAALVWLLRVHPRPWPGALLHDEGVARGLTLLVDLALMLAATTLCARLARLRDIRDHPALGRLALVVVVGAAWAFQSWQPGAMERWRHDLRPGTGMEQRITPPRDNPLLDVQTAYLLIRATSTDDLLAASIHVNDATVKAEGVRAARLFEHGDNGPAWYALECPVRALRAPSWRVVLNLPQDAPHALALEGHRTRRAGPRLPADAQLASLLFGAPTAPLPWRGRGGAPAFHFTPGAEETLSLRTRQGRVISDDLADAPGMQSGAFAVRMALARRPRISWHSEAPGLDKSAVLVFAVAAGDVPGRAMLHIDGRRALTFEHGLREDARWLDEDVELLYEAEPDAPTPSGTCFLRLGESWLVPHRPPTLAVTLAPQENVDPNAWFALAEIEEIARSFDRPRRLAFTDDLPAARIGGYTHTLAAPRQTLIETHLGLTPVALATPMWVWDLQ